MIPFRRICAAGSLLVCIAWLGPGVVEARKKRAKAETAGPTGQKLEGLVGDAEKLPGLLTFYRSPTKLYLELPPDLADAALGFSVVRVNAAGDFVTRGGELDNQLVRWRRVGDHLVLSKENLDFRADADSGLSEVVQASFVDSPVFSARLIDLSDDPAPWLIDATKLFGPDLAEVLSDRAGYGVSPDDAILVSLKTFEDNVVARVTYRAKRKAGGNGSGDGGANPFTRFLRPGRLPDPRSMEVTVDYNFYRLPDDDGFRPRFEDERIGGMTVSYKDYSDLDGRDTLFRHLLRRWDVRRPITFYMDHSVPEKWRPLVREASEWWNTAFRKIGVDNAVRVLDPPSDPDWDPADIRHSVIYWNLSDDLVFSGMAGPSFIDPRTGKVLKANVHINGEFFSFALHRYLVYAWWRAPEPGWSIEMLRERDAALGSLRGRRGMCDRAASFSSQIAFARLVLQARGILKPGSAEADRFAREAFDELVAHEVGHALGFPHNWKASLVSSWDAVKSGHVGGVPGSPLFSSSVMDYNPIYLAPAGEPQGDYFLRGLGPYDDLAVEYLYRPLDGLSDAEAERTLDRIAARAEVEPGLVYDGGELGGIDPTTSSDDLGDDPLRFAESRLVLLRAEVLPRLPELVLGEGHDYSLLRQALDSAIFSVAMDYIDIAARYVGGQILLRRVADSPAAPGGGPPPIAPLPAARQREALDILDRNLFADDAFPVTPELLQRMKADLQYDWNYPWRYASDYDVGSRIAGLYDAALSTLFEPRRLARVLDNERRVAENEDRFTLPELFDRLESAAFTGGRISADRRALQRALVRRLVAMTVDPNGSAPAEASQLAARSLRSIRERAAARLAGESEPDGYTGAHLADLAMQADQALDARIQLPATR